jgi:hypothetical protein
MAGGSSAIQIIFHLSDYTLFPSGKGISSCPSELLAIPVIRRNRDLAAYGPSAASVRCQPQIGFAGQSLRPSSGRQVRLGKRGAIPADLAPILERLQVAARIWERPKNNFDRV